MKRTIAAVVTVLTLGACSGKAPGEMLAGDAPAPSSTVKMATVGQLAGIVAQHEADLRQATRTAETCALLFDRCGQADSLSFTMLHTVARTLRLQLDAADDARPENRLYLGAYPPEIERLTHDTMAAALETASAAERFAVGDPCTLATPPRECAGLALLAHLAADDLVAQLDAWRPYL